MLLPESKRIKKNNTSQKTRFNIEGGARYNCRMVFLRNIVSRLDCFWHGGKLALPKQYEATLLRSA